MAIEDARLLAEAMAEWKPYHAIISDSWDDFCVTFTGHPADVIDQLCKAVVANPSQKVTLPPPAMVMADAPVLAEPRRPTKEEQADKGVVNTVIRGSTNATYLAARLKRDNPEIAAAVSRGEFKSMRQAAIAAGIVREKTRLEKIQTLFSGATADEKREIREWVSNQPE